MFGENLVSKVFDIKDLVLLKYLSIKVSRSQQGNFHFKIEIALDPEL